jgi:hypothetical protein
MMNQRAQFAGLVALSAVIGSHACAWTDEDSEEFYSMLVVGTVIGAIFSIICIVLASLPLCCGIVKPKANIIAAVVITIGIIACFVPAITGKAQADGAVNKMCDRCEADVHHTGCTNKERSDAQDAVGALGILVAYVHGFGFMVVILGITASAMGCCICCKCCKMKDDQFSVGQQPAVIGQAVVGQPVGAPCNGANQDVPCK